MRLQHNFTRQQTRRACTQPAFKRKVMVETCTTQASLGSFEHTGLRHSFGSGVEVFSLPEAARHEFGMCASASASHVHRVLNNTVER